MGLPRDLVVGASEWTTSRLHKYLYRHVFNILTDHKALEFIFKPRPAIDKVPSAILQRWGRHLSGYNNSIIHWSDKKNSYYRSWYAHSKDPVENSDNSTPLSIPLPVMRSDLINVAKLAHRPVLVHLDMASPNLLKASCVSSGLPRADGRSERLQWSSTNPSRLKEGSATVYSPRPRRRRQGALFGSLIYWWPTLRQDILSFIKERDKCWGRPTQLENVMIVANTCSKFFVLLTTHQTPHQSLHQTSRNKQVSSFQQHQHQPPTTHTTPTGKLPAKTKESSIQQGFCVLYAFLKAITCISLLNSIFLISNVQCIEIQVCLF